MICFFETIRTFRSVYTNSMDKQRHSMHMNTHKRMSERASERNSINGWVGENMSKRFFQTNKISTLNTPQNWMEYRTVLCGRTRMHGCVCVCFIEMITCTLSMSYVSERVIEWVRGCMYWKRCCTLACGMLPSHSPVEKWIKTDFSAALLDFTPFVFAFVCVRFHLILLFLLLIRFT